MKITGIYKIQSKIKPERIYIGSAVDIATRWRDHLSNFKKGKKANAKILNHIYKYGVEDLEFSIVEECCKHCLIEREQFYLDSLKPHFNIRPIAENNLGIKHSLATKLQMSISRKGDKHPRYGRHCSEETKEKIRISHLGKEPWNKGKKNIYSEEVLNKMRKPKSEETKKKLSDIAKTKYGRRKRNKKGQFS